MGKILINREELTRRVSLPLYDKIKWTHKILKKDLIQEKKLFNRIAFLNVFIMIALFCGVVFSIYFLLSNPEGIGAFIGKIIKGVKSAH